MKYLVEVEKAKEVSDGIPSMGPVYRSVLDERGFPSLDGIKSCWDLFSMSVKNHPNNLMLGQREITGDKAGKYRWKTYKEIYDLVIRVGNSLRSCGVGPMGKCGIYGTNCTEWVTSMEACNAHGIYCVPLYDTLGAEAVEFILCQAEVSIVFVEEKKIGEVLKTLPKTSEYVKTIVSFSGITTDELEVVKKFDTMLYTWEDFLNLGNSKHYELPDKSPSDICTIMYTSGTTGDPKGVMISNENIITFIAGARRLLEEVNEELTPNDVYISYLPLAHIFDRVVEELFIYHAGAIGFWRGDVKLLIDDIGELKPTVFCAVPRVLDRLHAGLLQKISSGSFLKKKLFDLAYAYKLGCMRNGSTFKEASPVCDRVVFSKVKQGLGGRVRLLLSGAAPLSIHVEAFLRVVSCAHVLQGYGLTETCGGSFVSMPNDFSMLGSVGPPLPYVDICLKSVPEMGYDALSSTPRGEICIRGKTVFLGYYKRDDLTNEVLFDGWFHTGDIGELQPDGSMKIIDRKKNIFKLSQGEYVAAENLENIYIGSPIIDSIWVYGSSYQSFLVAVVNPNKNLLQHWAVDKGMSEEFVPLCEKEETKEHILGELAKVAKEKKLKGFEFVKAVHLDPEPFETTAELLTPTFKKKRPQFLRHYQGVIDNMYNGTKA